MSINLPFCPTLYVPQQLNGDCSGLHLKGKYLSKYFWNQINLLVAVMIQDSYLSCNLMIAFLMRQAFLV